MKKTLQSIQELKEIQILNPEEIIQLKGGGKISIIMIDDLAG